MNDGKLIVILGRRGQGKTLLGYTLYNEARNLSYWVSMFDPVYSLKSRPVKIYRDLRAFDRDERVYLKTYFKFIGDQQFFEWFERVVSQVYSNTQNWNLFVDEVSYFITPAKVQEHLEFLVAYGRPMGINLVFIAQRPQQVNPLIMSQADAVILFQVVNLRDLDYLKWSYGIDFQFLQSIHAEIDSNGDLIQSQFYIYRDISALSLL